MSAHSPEHEITRLLDGWRDGDVAARSAVIEQVYATVRAIAAHSLRAQHGATMATTELAHEALLRLLGAEPNWADRRHLFHVVAQATRQVLVDAARKRLAGKRGAGLRHVEFDSAAEISAGNDDLILVRIDDALKDLASDEPRRARMVELVYFGGFSRAEIAAAMELSEGTVDRDLRLARAWLKLALAP